MHPQYLGTVPDAVGNPNLGPCVPHADGQSIDREGMSPDLAPTPMAVQEEQDRVFQYFSFSSHLFVSSVFLSIGFHVH